MKHRVLPSPARTTPPRSIRRRGRARLFTVGAAVTATSIAMAGPALASPAAPAGQAAQGDLTAATHAFDIPAGPIESVAAAFEQLTGLRVSLMNAALGTLPSPGVRGSMTARAAMTQLLMGTSLQASYSAAGVELGIAQLSEDVQVVGRAATVSSPRYTVPLRDIAATVALVPRTIIEQQTATTLTEVLRNVPGITLQAGEGGGSSSAAGDQFNMRGFSANNSIFVDNVRDSGLISRDVFNLEQVEVFMGPTGSDVGRGTAAGYVNMQTKRPHLGTTTSVLLTAGSSNQGRVAADFNWGAPAGATGGTWLSKSAIRLNALWQDRGVPGRDEVKNESRAFAPSVALGLETSTRVFASAQVMRQDNTPDYGVPSAAWSENLLAPTVVLTPRPVAQTNFYGNINYDYDKVDQDSFTGRVEHDVNRRLTIASQTRYNTTHRQAVVSAITGVASYVPATGLVTVARQGNERENTIFSNQTTLVNRFATGRLRHGLSGGVEVLREEQFSPTITGFGTRTPAATVSIYSPNPNDPITGLAVTRTLAQTDGTTNSVALYANDAVEVGQRWLVSGGFRLERYSTGYVAIDATGLTTTDVTADGNLFSGRGSVLFRLNNDSNLYVSYGTTVTPPGEGNFQLSTAANNVNNPNVDPQRSANFEVGTKVDTAGGRLSLNGAAFRTRNRNVIYTVDAVAIPPVFNQDDDQLVKGVTVGALGRLTDRWQILANAAYMDATLRSQGPNNGREIALTPAFSGSLWSTIRVIGGLNVGGGVRHVGAAYVNAANTIRIPSYAIVDGLVEYTFRRNLTLRANLNNLTDAKYIRSINNNGGRYNPGYTRNVLVTMNAGF
jgi:catecholate siderophore receptor